MSEDRGRSRSALSPARSTGAPPPGTRVQRVTADLPVLHLERDVPSSAADLELVVDGLVDNSLSWPVEQIHNMAMEQRSWDINCVWGWTRLGCRWAGVPLARLIDAARPLPEAGFVMANAMNNTYSSCLTLNRARRSLLAWRLDGADLSAEHGWPLRLVPPPTKWAYKHVKWVSRLTLIKDFTPGFWEGLVGDPHGDIPAEILGHLDENDSGDRP